MQIDNTDMCAYTEHDVLPMSRIINLLRVPLIITVVLLHSYTATQNMEWTGKNGDLYTFVSYELSLVLGNVAVPVFFFISGYLFFLHERIPKIDYVSKWKRRLETLFVPYILWNIMTLGLYLSLQLIPATAKYFTNDHNIIYSYSLIDFFRSFWDCGDWNAGNGTPILSPFWFIRNLMILSLLAPIIYWLNKRLKMWWIVPLVMLWCVTYNMATPQASIVFFGIGSYMGERKINMIYAHRRVIFYVISAEVLLLLLHNYLHFFTDDVILALISQRLMYILAIPIFFWIGDFFYKKGFKAQKNDVAFAFVIFACHYTLILMLRKALIYMFPDAGDMASSVLYLLSVVVVVALCWIIYKILSKVPFVRMVLCGGR
ncbi:MAG: acyltransferase [Flavobacteriales bacterium]|nr:acyltransferase [Flavobacteriales bacterium]